MKKRLKMVGYYPFLLLLLIWMTAPTHGQKSNPYRKQLQEQQATESHRENQEKPNLIKKPIIGLIKNVSTPIGRDAILNCFVSKDIENLMIAWIKVNTSTVLTMNKMVITKNTRISVYHSFGVWALTIRNVKASDRGWYMCQTNTDPMESQMGFLDVTEPPSFNDKKCSGDATVPEKHSAKFICSVNGYPNPKISWKREDDKIISGNVKEVAQGSVLQFPSVTKDHAGAYLCIASNEIPPRRSKRFLLTVLYPPTVQMNVEVVKVPLGDKVQLNCSAFGSPSPNLYWKREDRNIHTNYKHEISVKKNGNNSSSQLTIKNLSKEDHYVTYTCLGKNSQGTAVDAVSIQVTEKLQEQVPYETEVDMDLLEEKKSDLETKFQTNRPKPTKSTVFDIYETKRINETPYSGRSHYNFNMANVLNIPSLLYYISILFWLMFVV